LPEEITKSSDSYPDQLNKTAQKIANLTQLRKWSVAYQSAGMRGGPWLGPDIEETISSLANNGQKKILIAPIGFLSDNLETLYDIDVRCQELATSLGVDIRRAELLNDDSTFIEAIASKVADLLSR
jgi:ferrochelatase|tara:strand:- start:306 stop:683 length:378 start_codon:yes stop_codon:yes gene_type:complete